MKNTVNSSICVKTEKMEWEYLIIRPIMVYNICYFLGVTNIRNV